MDLEAKKGKLNFYRQCCDRATELMKYTENMKDTEKTAPDATEVIKRSIPILDKNLKELLVEIQNKAKIACQKSQGTPTQEIACSVNQEIEKLEIDNLEETSLYIPNIVLILKSKIPPAPENKEILDKIESMNYEKDISRVLNCLLTVIGLIPTVNNTTINVNNNSGSSIIVWSPGSSIGSPENKSNPPTSHRILKLIFEHPITSGVIATVIGGVILALLENKYLF